MRRFSRSFTHPLFQSRHQSGLGLIEVMIAMSIGLLVVAAAGEVLIASKNTYRLQEGQSRLQETGRYLMQTLAEEIRYVGYQGCRSVGLIPPAILANAPILPFAGDTMVQAHDGQSSSAWTPALSSGLTTLNASTDAALPKIKGQTDVLTLQSSESCNARLRSDMASAGADLQVNADNSCGFAAGDVVIIADCRASDIVRISSVSTSSGITTLGHGTGQNSSGSLQKPYSAEAEIFRLRSFSFFVGSIGSGEPALWRFDNTRSASSTSGSENPVAISDGAEDLQLQLGIDTDGDGAVNQTLAPSSSSLTDWNNVLSVRVDLLVRSGSDYIVTQAQPYSFNGSNNLVATDRRLRREFAATVGLRNRLQ